VFDKVSIRTKLIAIVAAPLAVIVALAGLGFTQRRAESSDTRVDAARLRVIQASLALQHEVSVEALHSVTVLASDGTLGERSLAAQRTRTDRGARALQGALPSLESSDETAVNAASGALRKVDQLDASLRPQVDSGLIRWEWAEGLYSQVLDSLVPIGDRLVPSISDGALARGARSLLALDRYTETQARIGTLLTGAAATGRFPAITEEAPGEGGGPESGLIGPRESFDEALTQADVDLSLVGTEAGADIRTRLRNQVTGADVSFFDEQVSVADDLAADAPLTIDAERLSAAVAGTLEQLTEVASSEATAVLDAASERVADADQSARYYLVGALLAVLLALTLALVVAASIARPVMSLTAAADRVATDQLPRLVVALRSPDEVGIDHLRPSIEHLDVGGGRELARLTASVNSIQEVAVTVATEQAALLRKGIGEMFVNLARRNQGLLDRQLEFIDELEAQEEDPDQLGHLFKLDHMATRMRRNAESLLVLAGTEPIRRRGGPVPLAKVALAAVGEIEHFDRVDLLDIDECEVTSKSAADVAHLLSELMENATQFSPPDSRVEVVGHKAQVSGYTISITDQGIGMSADQIVEANELMNRPPLLGLTLARTLGFIVVSRLAARHNISVRLASSPSGGVSAIVGLPRSVLVASADPLDPTTATPGAKPPSRHEPIFDAPRLPVASSDAYGDGSHPVPADGPAGDPAPAPADEAARVTASGLVKRVPQRSGGDRPLPGSDGKTRAATTPTRSPDEVRSMLARFQSGRQAGQDPDSIDPTTAAPPSPAAPSPPPSVDSSPPRAPVAPADDPAPLTAAGLVRRTPRRAGAGRADSGSDGESRVATTTNRSPEEVRSMLSRFRSGRQAGQDPGPDRDQRSPLDALTPSPASSTSDPSDPKER